MAIVYRLRRAGRPRLHQPALPAKAAAAEIQTTQGKVARIFTLARRLSSSSSSTFSPIIPRSTRHPLPDRECRRHARAEYQSAVFCHRDQALGVKIDFNATAPSNSRESSLKRPDFCIAMRKECCLSFCYSSLNLSEPLSTANKKAPGR